MARKKGEGHFRKEGEYHVWVLALGDDPRTGKPKRKVIKRKDLKELKKLVRQYLRDREDGTPSATGNAITCGQWADKWLANVKAHREESTYLSYLNTWEKWLRQPCARKKLEQLGTLDIQAAVDAARAEGKDRTAIYIHSVAKRMLNAARRHSPPYIVHDPCAGVVVPEDAPERQRILSHEEVDEVLEELYRKEAMVTREGETHAYRHRHLVRFILETGMRRSEACGLQQFNVDLIGEPNAVRVAAQVGFVDGKLRIKPYTKAKSIRTIPLTNAAVEALKSTES